MGSYEKKFVSTEELFLLMYSIWLFTAIISVSSMYAFIIPRIIFYLIRISSIAIMAFLRISFRGRLTGKEFGITLLAVIITFSLFHYWGAIYAEGMAIVFIGYRFSFNKIAKKSVLIILAAMAFIILSSQLGIIVNFNYAGVVKGSVRKRRYGLGFSYATYASHYTLLVIMLIAYLKRERVRWRTILLLFVLNIYICRNCVQKFVYIIHPCFDHDGCV